MSDDANAIRILVVDDGPQSGNYLDLDTRGLLGPGKRAFRYQLQNRRLLGD
jgi:hypothetical protein